MPRNLNTNRRSRKNEKPKPVISMTQTEAFALNQTLSSDAVCIKGKLLGSASATVTPSQIVNFNPNGLGPRVAKFAAVFDRFRIKYVRIKWLPTGTTNVFSSLGVLDDSGSGGLAPTNTAETAELRSSSTVVGNTTVPTQFTWIPVDRKEWYFCPTEGSSGDPRLQVPGVLYASAPSATTVAYEIDYSIVFAGAIDAA